MERMIKLRAHHLLCIPRFYSGGYNKKFAKNMKKIVQNIRKNPDRKIRIIIGKNDDLCNSCPYWGKTHCIQTEKMNDIVIGIDKRVAKSLKIKNNSIYKAKDIFNLSVNKIADDKIRHFCKDCQFLDECIEVGMNRSFIKDTQK